MDKHVDSELISENGRAQKLGESFWTGVCVPPAKHEQSIFLPRCLWIDRLKYGTIHKWESIHIGLLLDRRCVSPTKHEWLIYITLSL